MNHLEKFTHIKGVKNFKDSKVELAGVYGIEDLKNLIKLIEAAERDENEIDGERLWNFGKVFADSLEAVRKEFPNMSDDMRMLAASAKAQTESGINKREMQIIKNLAKAGKMAKLADVRLLLDYEPVIEDYL